MICCFKTVSQSAQTKTLLFHSFTRWRASQPEGELRTKLHCHFFKWPPLLPLLVLADDSSARYRCRVEKLLCVHLHKKNVCIIAWAALRALASLSFPLLSLSFRLIAVGRSSHFFLSLSRHSSLSFNVGKMTRFSPSIHPSFLSLSLYLSIAFKTIGSDGCQNQSATLTLQPVFFVLRRQQNDRSATPTRQ